MKWTRFRIKTCTDAEDIIISALYDRGLMGAQIEDKIPLSPLEKEQMFVDIMPETEEDDHIAYLGFFVEESEEGMLKVFDGTDPAGNDVYVLKTADEVLKVIEEELKSVSEYCEIGEGSVLVDETEDLDWINNWKKYFHQFYIDDILVIPSWEKVDVKDKDKMILHIDPGTAFGTGMHETTRLCIENIRKYMKKGDTILDVGTGSGILSIIALMLGAKSALGTDLDICCVDAVKNNCEDNGINPADFELVIGNIITDKEVQDKAGYEKYDMVFANILAEVLIPLTPVVKNHLKKDGIYITSGIIDTKEEAVKNALESAGFEILNVSHKGEWVGIAARKR